MIFREVSFDDFVREFKEYGREDNFSTDGLKALYDHLWESAEENCTPFALDVIAVCCEYTEYSLEEGKSEFSDFLEDEDTIDEVLDTLNYRTSAFKTDSDTIIVANF